MFTIMIWKISITHIFLYFLFFMFILPLLLVSASSDDKVSLNCQDVCKICDGRYEASDDERKNLCTSSLRGCDCGIGYIVIKVVLVFLGIVLCVQCIWFLVFLFSGGSNQNQNPLPRQREHPVHPGRAWWAVRPTAGGSQMMIVNPMNHVTVPGVVLTNTDNNDNSINPPPPLYSSIISTTTIPTLEIPNVNVVGILDISEMSELQASQHLPSYDEAINNNASQN